jgi:hypothetical protein
MRLVHPFYRLPLRLDAARLQLELAQFAAADWRRHPEGFPGNSAIRLITVDGEENDDFAGPMKPTSQLQRCPYIRQVLAALGAPWSRSRLMRLEPGCSVPPHADINYHWVDHVRVHIPIVTDVDVRFSCGDRELHMAAGDVWVFDNWRVHAVDNRSTADRVHLVADTCGSAAFWQWVGAAQAAGFESAVKVQTLAFQSGLEAQPLLEGRNVSTVMHPAEVEQIVRGLLADLGTGADLSAVNERFAAFARTFCQEWRMLWAVFGESLQGWPQFRRLRDWALSELAHHPATVASATNGMPMREIFRVRLLLYVFNVPGAEVGPDIDHTLTGGGQSPAQQTAELTRSVSICGPTVERPLFIVAAPRSGSTLLFETLARAPQLYTVGGEAHWLVEQLPQLQPWAPGVGSNRLTATHVDVEIREFIRAQLRARMRDRDGYACSAATARLLEKTPKHALRIPFFDALFPDARFIFLWRDPYENLGSIIDAWNDGRWTTYAELPGWRRSWSLLLPPGWEALRDAPLEEIAAFQWQRTNEIVLDDLAKLPQERWTHLSYAQLLNDPVATIRQLCGFAGVDFDDRLAAYLARPLPLSSLTLKPPAVDKWHRHAAAIERVMPALQPVLQRLQALPSQASGSRN